MAGMLKQVLGQQQEGWTCVQNAYFHNESDELYLWSLENIGLQTASG